MKPLQDRISVVILEQTKCAAWLSIITDAIPVSITYGLFYSPSFRGLDLAQHDIGTENAVGALFEVTAKHRELSEYHMPGIYTISENF
jgi:hypothetical protein